MSELIEQDVKPVSLPAQVSPMQLMEVALTTGKVDQFERLIAMQEKFDAAQARKSFFAAMAGFQSDVPVIMKLKQGHNCKYAPIEDIAEQIKPVQMKHGFSYRFEQEQNQNMITVSCIITHIDGHSESTKLTAGADTSGSKSAIQSIASAITYLRRYCLTGAFGLAVADEDTDGRLAGMNNDLDLTEWSEAINRSTNIQQLDGLVNQARQQKLIVQLNQVFKAKRKELQNAHTTS